MKWTTFRDKPKKRTRKFNPNYKIGIQYNIITVINEDNYIHRFLVYHLFAYIKVFHKVKSALKILLINICS